MAAEMERHLESVMVRCEALIQDPAEYPRIHLVIKHLITLFSGFKDDPHALPTSTIRDYAIRLRNLKRISGYEEESELLEREQKLRLQRQSKIRKRYKALNQLRSMISTQQYYDLMSELENF